MARQARRRLVLHPHLPLLMDGAEQVSYVIGVLLFLWAGSR
ncbi:MAG TPA: hypothetical protein VGK41_05575 [Solirubrobacterales bacterium]